MKVVLGIIGLTISNLLVGQVESRQGRFSVEFSRGCAPFTVSVSEDDNLGNVSRAYTYEPGATQTVDTFYTYTQPGTYQIIQLIGATIDQNGDTLTIEVLEPRQPAIEYSVCADGGISLSITDTYYDSYRLTTTNVNTELSSATTLSIELTEFDLGTNPSVSVTGLFDGGLSNCGITEFQPEFIPFSNAIIVQDYDIEFVCDDLVNLNLYVEPTPNTWQDILWNASTGYQSIFEGLITEDTLTFSDLPASGDICFRIDALSLCNGQRITGSEFCQSFTPGDILFDDAYATYSGNDILINLEPNSFGSYHVTKITDDIIVREYPDAPDSILDQSINPLRSYLYEVIFETECDSPPLTTTLAPPYIQADRIAGNQYNISFEPARNDFSELLDYTLSIGSEANGFSEINAPSNPEIINIDLQLGQNQTIQLYSTNQDHPILFSNPIDVDYEFVVYVPKAFTPDGNGINDRLELFGLPSDRFTLTIYNRWGEKVFVSSSTENFWDGKSPNGRRLEGTFSYTLEFFNEDGELFYQEGSFVLLK